MDTLEIVGYSALGVLLLAGIASMVFGFIQSGPGMYVGLFLAVGLGALMLKVVKERLANDEDDHYSNTVDK